MTHIFLDESGDLGFGERSSRWFMLTMVLTASHRQIEKCVKKTHRDLNKKKVYVDLQNQKNYLYNYTANILLDRLHNKSLLSNQEKIHIVIDQRETNKFLKKNFENYLTDNLVKRGNNGFEIKIRPSHA